MEKTMDLRRNLRSSLRSRKGKELTLAFNCKDYNLFFTGTIGAVYINAFFQGDKYPFSVINCWNYVDKKSGINGMLDFTNHIVDFVYDNADDLPVYFYNRLPLGFYNK